VAQLEPLLEDSTLVTVSSLMTRYTWEPVRYAWDLAPPKPSAGMRETVRGAGGGGASATLRSRQKANNRGHVHRHEEHDEQHRQQGHRDIQVGARGCENEEPGRSR